MKNPNDLMRLLFLTWFWMRLWLKRFSSEKRISISVIMLKGTWEWVSNMNLRGRKNLFDKENHQRRKFMSLPNGVMKNLFSMRHLRWTCKFVLIPDGSMQILTLTAGLKVYSKLAILGTSKEFNLSLVKSNF